MNFAILVFFLKNWSIVFKFTILLCFGLLLPPEIFSISEGEISLTMSMGLVLIKSAAVIELEFRAQNLPRVLLKKNIFEG